MSMPYKSIIKKIEKDSPVIMGVLNMTPDSFSDGGKFNKPTTAVKRAIEMEKQGALIIDIGAESSRPGAKPVTLKKELQRLIPVITQLRKKSKVLISVDTYKPEVAAICLKLGADIINDISGLRNQVMRSVIAQSGCPVILMHMLGTPGTMQKHPRYKNVITDIKKYFTQQIKLAKQSGIKQHQIILDPGIGFGKTVKHNLEIINNFEKFKSSKLPLLIGASRKSFIGKITNTKEPDRLPGSLATHLLAIQKGANIVRVHDVAEHQQMLQLYKAFNL